MPIDPAGDITLREGLDRFRQENAVVLSDREVSADALAFFRCHDTAHVVFNCDTSLLGEGMVKIFTIFGTTLGFRKHLSSYAEAEAFSLFRQYGGGHVARNVFWLSLNAPRAFIRARRMNRPWPWDNHSEYLDRTLEDIREEFNILVFPDRH